MKVTKQEYLGLVLSFGLVSSANAAIQPTRCNACTEAQYETTAYNDVVARHQATGYTYVYDMSFNQFRKYAAEREPNGDGTYTYNVYPVTPTSSELSTWSQEKSDIAANGGHSTFVGVAHQNTGGFPVPSANSETVVNTSAYRNQIGAWMVTPSANIYVNSGMFTLSSLVNLASSMLLKSDILAATIVVYMNDGGKITFQWTGGDTQASFVSAVDADMNDIPVSRDHLPGGYVFSHDNGPAFVNYLNSRFGLNVEVCLNGQLACTGDGNNNYSCTWVTCGGLP